MISIVKITNRRTDEVSWYAKEEKDNRVTYAALTPLQAIQLKMLLSTPRGGSDGREQIQED